MSRHGVIVKHLAMRGPHVSARRPDPGPDTPSRGDPFRNPATDLTRSVPVGDTPPLGDAGRDPAAGSAQPPSRCEIDPEMYRIFAFAVLGWHRRLPKAGGDRCACGAQWLSCEYVDLADKLLWTGAGSWRSV